MISYTILFLIASEEADAIHIPELATRVSLMTTHNQTDKNALDEMLKQTPSSLDYSQVSEYFDNLKASCFETAEYYENLGREKIKPKEDTPLEQDNIGLYFYLAAYFYTASAKLGFEPAHIYLKRLMKTNITDEVLQNASFIPTLQTKLNELISQEVNGKPIVIESELDDEQVLSLEAVTEELKPVAASKEKTTSETSTTAAILEGRDDAAQPTHQTSRTQPQYTKEHNDTAVPISSEAGVETKRPIGVKQLRSTSTISPEDEESKEHMRRRTHYPEQNTSIEEQNTVVPTITHPKKKKLLTQRQLRRGY